MRLNLNINNKMASEDEELRVVRCSYSELKELAIKLETPRYKTREQVPKTSPKSTVSTKQSGGNLDEKRENRRSEVERRKYNNKPVLPPHSQSGKKLSKNSNSKISVQKERPKDDTVVVDKDQKEKGIIRKNVRLSAGSQNKSQSRQETIAQKNTAEHSDTDYDRGESPYSSSPRSLYNPETDDGAVNYPVKPESSRKRSNYPVNSSREFYNHNLTNMMGELHVGSSKRDHSADSSGDSQCLREGKSLEDSQQKLKKIQRKKAESLFTDIGYLEGDIDNLLSRRLTSEEQLGHITNLSNEIQEKCKSIMLTDLYFFTNKEVYHILWRSGFYQIIERVRGLQKDNQDYDGVGDGMGAKISSILQGFLDSASSFISGMISSLEKEQGFLLKSFLEKPTKYDGCNHLLKMALLCCHHFMIFLGDIERYKQQLLSIKEWSAARSCYLKASKIAPRNGKPYNQLAVIAVYAKRRLDAVYYYIRSLTVSSPILTAREKLHAIYDDVQRKAYELHVRAQEMDDALQYKQKLANGTENGRRNDMRRGRRRCRSEGRENTGLMNDKKMGEGRHELWVFYRGGVRQEFLFTPGGLVKGGNTEQESNEKQEKPNIKISLNEINKQFEIFYLCCHAMLYSKIGIDNFSDNHRKVLGLFRTLLRHPTCSAVGMKRLVEIMAINIFEVENMSNEDFGQVFEGTPLDLAINLGSDMFQCVCKTTTEILLQQSNDASSSGDDVKQVILANYLPAIKVWFDWMRNSITVLRSSSVSIKEEFWSSVSVLLNSLSQVYVMDGLSDVAQGDSIITLAEDDHLNGFKILAQASKPRAKIESISEKELACKKLRIEAIQVIAKFLCEFEDLPLRYDESSHQYYITKVTVTMVTDGTDDREYIDEIKEEDIDDDVIVESVEDFDSDTELVNPVKELKAKKDALTKEILNQKQREKDAKAVLVEHSSKPTLVLEINPQYLVPDTNCFIDHLSDLQYIVESRDFTIVIPLVVINELDGLAKGASAVHHQQQQRADYVAACSRAAIDFLEYRFSLSDSQMLALTSKGSVLSTIAFRSEEPTEGRGINDDVILNCCTHYCDTKMDVVNKLASADQPFTIRRKVVLLTEDRNLRLKAHVQNIPVVTVPQFLEMIVP